MKQKVKVICFIDDDPAEVQAFKNVFSDHFVVIAETTPQKALDQLLEKKIKPNLFVLDLYFARDKASSDSERNRMVELKEEVDKAQKRLSDYLSKIGQCRDGGIEIMHYVQGKFPTIPVVFYTRKGTLEDAVACMDEGADGVFPKAVPAHFDPTGDRVSQFEKAAQEQHDSLATRFFCKASTSNILKKLIRVFKFVWENWKKF